MTLPRLTDDALVAAHKEVIEHCVAEKPREAVGVIWSDAVVTPLINEANGEGHVYVPRQKLIELVLSRPDPYILSIYHSHPKGTVEPSDTDMAWMQKFGHYWEVEWTIVALQSGKAIMSTWHMDKIPDPAVSRIHHLTHYYPSKYVY